MITLLRNHDLPTDLPSDNVPHRIILIANTDLKFTITKLNSDIDEYSIRSNRGE